MSGEFQVLANNPNALFSLKIHRGDGMALLAMDWKNGRPPDNFVGFAIQYTDPTSAAIRTLQNRLNFAGAPNPKGFRQFPTTLAPIQKFRWVHFPRQALPAGNLTYTVTPVFMDAAGKLSNGDTQQAAVALTRETYPGQLNVAYTRGFISSQAFVDQFKSVSKILPEKAPGSLKFVPTASNAQQALTWMGFEARAAIIEVLEKAIADVKAEVRVVAYDLNEPEIVSRLEKLGSRLKVIIDDSGTHKPSGANEGQAAKLLMASAGAANVKREHMGSLQHNKFIAVNGPTYQLAVCGSTNFSWRALYVQSNNAIVFTGAAPVKLFFDAFDQYWSSPKVVDFGESAPATWQKLGLANIDAQIAFSPHSSKNALLQSVADDMQNGTTSSLLYSLAFLYETKGPIRDAIQKLTNNPQRFVYGLSDRKVGGIVLQKPDGNLAPLFPSALEANVPLPFKAEPTGGGGTRLHHKFVVIDFDKPTARVYMGSYNFSSVADLENGENLTILRDRRLAVSYAVEAVSMLDHYQFRVLQLEAKTAKKTLELTRPPSKLSDKPWFDEDYTDIVKIHDRQLFS